jgi:folate-dependent phosphoribosylglycinamide formyltransferase PurN
MAAQLVFDPIKGPLKYACGVSGSGSNYERIHEASPGAKHVVFSNTPQCSGVVKAAGLGASLALLDSHRYFSDMWGLDKIPRHGIERDSFDRAIMTLVEQQVPGMPDLMCLAGYDLWIGSWMVDRYFPRILNVHPGDSKYPGLGWRPTAKAILAGEPHVRSTVFFVDASDDGGPILIQSASIPLSRWDSELREIRKFADHAEARTLSAFREAAVAQGNSLYHSLETVSSAIQDVLKVEGDWKIYPFAVHELIGKGRVALDGRTVFIDGVPMPENGWQVDTYGYSSTIK